MCVCMCAGCAFLSAAASRVYSVFLVAEGGGGSSDNGSSSVCEKRNSAVDSKTPVERLSREEYEAGSALRNKQCRQLMRLIEL